jgi:hypothetical protein
MCPLERLHYFGVELRAGMSSRGFMISACPKSSEGVFWFLLPISLITCSCPSTEVCAKMTMHKGLRTHGPLCRNGLQMFNVTASTRIIFCTSISCLLSRHRLVCLFHARFYLMCAIWRGFTTFWWLN